MEKPTMAYPCRWAYKLIGSEVEQLRCAIAEVVQGREHAVTLSRTSRTGKYCCLNLELVVHDDEDRVRIFEALRRHPATHVVL
jgi:putative lipoic acid-binding regulatory protein